MPKLTLVLDGPLGPAHAPLLVAHKLSLFGSWEPLALDWVEPAPGQDPLSLLQAGVGDAAIANLADLWKAVDGGAKLWGVAGLSAGSAAVIALADGPVSTGADLPRVRIGYAQGSTGLVERLLAREVFMNAGSGPGDAPLHLVPLTQEPVRALVAKAVPAIAVHWADPGLAVLHRMGKAVRVFTDLDAGIHAPLGDRVLVVRAPGHGGPPDLEETPTGQLLVGLRMATELWRSDRNRAWAAYKYAYGAVTGSELDTFDLAAGEDALRSASVLTSRSEQYLRYIWTYLSQRGVVGVYLPTVLPWTNANLHPIFKGADSAAGPGPMQADGPA